jgi:hypothetical protein
MIEHERDSRKLKVHRRVSKTRRLDIPFLCLMPVLQEYGLIDIPFQHPKGRVCQGHSNKQTEKQFEQFQKRTA